MSALINLVTLTCDLLTSNLVHVITHPGARYCSWVGQPPYQFWCFCFFCSCQQLSDWPRDLAILTFNLGGHGDCRWYGSLFSICVQSLNFIGFPIRKILCIYCMSINRPGNLTFDLLTLKLVHFTVHGVANLSTNFGVSGTLFLTNTWQTNHLATLTFDLGGGGAYGWYGSSTSVCVTSLKFVGLPIQKILHIYYVSINHVGDLDLWPFDL